MQNIINVTILNYNAQQQGAPAYIGLNGTALVLTTSNPTVWNMIPNLSAGAVTGGFTFYCAAAAQAACIPAPGVQIALNDDPTPYGAPSYCWTLWPTSVQGGVQLWAIQDNQRDCGMDAAGGGISDGTQILLYGWNGGDNQQWIITLV
jgi:hypothetical protein